MRFTTLLALVLIVALSGCTGTLYSHIDMPIVATDSGDGEAADVATADCTEIGKVSFGQTNGGCGVKTGTISVPGAALVGEMLKTAANGFLSFTGRRQLGDTRQKN